MTLYSATDQIQATKVDVYEAGIMFGYMFSGEPPFENLVETHGGMAVEEVLERIQRGERPSIDCGPRRVPAAIKTQVLDPMLSHIPYERPSFEHIRHVLSSLVN